jgi:hypothetical protein
VHNVARDFLSLADALLHSEHFANQISPTAVSDELSRFKVGHAKNIRAYHFVLTCLALGREYSSTSAR